MAEDPKQTELVRELTETWARAQEQFKTLREAAEYAGRLAELKEQVDFLLRERDHALRALGDAVWEEVKSGRMELPQGLIPQQRALEALEKQRASQVAEISSLLAEGEAAAVRVATPKKPVPQSAVARGMKKR